VIAYLDSSVLMRIVLRAPGSLKEWRRVDHYVSSALLSVECLRTIHRLHVLEPLSDEEFATRVETIDHALRDIELIGVNAIVLERASGSFSSPVKTLDAIHLATAVLWREREDASLHFATHDKQLGVVARAFGFSVLGL